MQRTASRPIPRGHVTPEEALTFGTVLAIGSVATLGLIVNWVAAALLAFTIAFYVLVYTMWLKRRTPQNIVIGGAAGAFPPMIGWAAATGSVGIESIVLFLIIFMWTPPHFWALALYRTRDYERAGVPMLPVVAGRRRDAQADRDLFRAAGAARPVAGVHRPRRRALCPGLDRARRRLPGVRARRLQQAARVARPTTRRGGSSPSPSSTCSGCSPRFSSNEASIDWSTDRERPRPVADDEQQEWERRRRMRSIAIALALAALVVLFYVATLVRLGGNVLNRPL